MGLQALYIPSLFLAFNRTLLICFPGHYNPEFSRNKTWHFNSNTLGNAEDYLRDKHFLDKGGDIWRIRPRFTAAQASGLVNGNYKRVIPFRQ
jgi:hypothetical protein